MILSNLPTSSRREFLALSGALAAQAADPPELARIPSGSFTTGMPEDEIGPTAS
jgi:hypothetical protein